MDSTTKIPGYKVVSKIGKGGMATVYLATQVSLARTVALKIMAPAMVNDESAKERFLKEGKIIAKLNHPHIVTVHDIGHFESLYYMAIEYIEGGSLTERISQGLSPRDAIEITKQVAEALGYAHKHGFIHRDVKPANILFREEGTVVLSDFGIAKGLSSDTALTVIGTTLGTPEYMSPEQLKGKPLDSRTDLYSLGVVLYEMLVRQKPFKGSDAFSTAVCHLSTPIPRLPHQLTLYQPVIEHLLAKEPDDRFATAEQLIEALDNVVTVPKHDAKSPRPETKSSWSATPVKTLFNKREETKPKPSKKTPSKIVKWAAVFFAVLVIGAATFWLLKPRLDPQTVMFINLLSGAGRAPDSRLAVNRARRR